MVIQINQTIAELRSISVADAVEPIPQFKEIKNRNTLYTRYGEASQLSYETARALSTAYSVRANIRLLTKTMRADTETPRSLIQAPQAELEHSFKVLEDVIQALTAKKEGVDSLVRFYSSAQYILGSPRLDGLE